MDSSIKKITTDKSGNLIIQTEKLIATVKGVFQRNVFYEWSNNSVLNHPVTKKIDVTDGDLYIDEEHWSKYIKKEDFEIYQKNGDKRMRVLLSVILGCVCAFYYFKFAFHLIEILKK